MMPLSIQARILIALALSAGCFAGGWIVHGWKNSAVEAAEIKAAQAAYVLASEKANDLSAKLQTSLDDLDSRKTTTLKEVSHEITKIEYRCLLPDAGRLLYNTAAGAAPGKPGNSLPGTPDP